MTNYSKYLDIYQIKVWDLAVRIIISNGNLINEKADEVITLIESSSQPAQLQSSTEAWRIYIDEWLIRFHSRVRDALQIMTPEEQKSFSRILEDADKKVTVAYYQKVE